MDAHFEEMLKRLKLTKLQKKDARTKYTNVAKILHNEFYETDYTGATKLLIGSYGKRTNIRPPDDVDLLFKIPAEVYSQYEDSPGALLQRIRKAIGKHYTTTEKISAWGKVVLVKFSDGKHNIELLPGLGEGGVFLIPNTEDGGGWESFDVGSDMAIVNDSDVRTSGKTRKLIKFIKRWKKKTSSVSMKSHQIEQYVAGFLNSYHLEGRSWPQITHDFFEWLFTNTTHTQDESAIQTAWNRAEKALEYELEDKMVEACNEWRKVFGNRTFPAYTKDLAAIQKISAQQPSIYEEHIEDRHPVRINPYYKLKINSVVTGKGFRDHSLRTFIQKYARLPRNMSLLFEAVHNIPGEFELLWKVRNFGPMASAVNQLRGEISEGFGIHKRESTAYLGTHYVECYAIKDGVCVARSLQFVPIGGDE